MVVARQNRQVCSDQPAHLDGYSVEYLIRWTSLGDQGRDTPQCRLLLGCGKAGRDLAEKHYAVHKGKPFYDSLLNFLTSGPTVAMVWEGREAVAVARALMGVTDGTKAAPGTIRGDFALSVQNNLVHGSDSPENAAMEIALWFRPDELVAYIPTDAAWVG